MEVKVGDKFRAIKDEGGWLKKGDIIEIDTVTIKGNYRVNNKTIQVEDLWIHKDWLDPNSPHYLFEKVEKNTEQSIEQDIKQEDWYPVSGKKYRVIKDIPGVIDKNTEIEIIHRKGIGHLFKDSKGYESIVFIEDFDPKNNPLFELIKDDGFKPSTTSQYIGKINNHGRETCIKCGDKTVPLELAFSISDRCPKCEP